MRTIVHYSVEIQVQVVKLGDVVLLDDLVAERVTLADPAEELSLHTIPDTYHPSIQTKIK